MIKVNWQFHGIRSHRREEADGDAASSTPPTHVGGYTGNVSPAFTLIEVLLAVAISAVVLAAINTVFFGALHLRMTTSRSLDASLPLEQALTLLRRDLQGAMPPGTNGDLIGDFKSGDAANGFGMTQKADWNSTRPPESSTTKRLGATSKESSTNSETRRTEPLHWAKT